MTSGLSITGLASGLDTQAIVSQLMALERRPVQQLAQRQAALRKVDDAWGQVVTKLSALRTSVDKIKQASAFDGHVATTSSHPDAVAVSKIGTPSVGSLSFAVTQLAKAHQVSLGDSANPIASLDETMAAGTLRLRQGTTDPYVEITTEGKTLTQLADEIRTALPGISASAVQIAPGDYQLVLAARETGLDYIIDMDLSSNPPKLANRMELQAALNAKVSMGSLTVERSSNRITDLVDGVAIELKAETASPVTVTTAKDNAASVAAIKDFVAQVNGVLSKLKDLTKYDAASKTAGALQGDGTARRLELALRSAVSDPVTGLTGAYTAASQIGIELDREGGVTLDETKLTAALEQDPAAVVALLTTSTTTPAVTGVVRAVGDVLSGAEGTTGSVGRARASLTTRIDDVQRSIDAYEVRLAGRERTLRAKFTALEVALARANQLNSGLASALSSLAPPQ